MGWENQGSQCQLSSVVPSSALCLPWQSPPSNFPTSTSLGLSAGGVRPSCLGPGPPSLPAAYTTRSHCLLKLPAAQLAAPAPAPGPAARLQSRDTSCLLPRLTPRRSPTWKAAAGGGWSPAPSTSGAAPGCVVQSWRCAGPQPPSARQQLSCAVLLVAQAEVRAASSRSTHPWPHTHPCFVVGHLQSIPLQISRVRVSPTVVTTQCCRSTDTPVLRPTSHCAPVSPGPCSPPPSFPLESPLTGPTHRQEPVFVTLQDHTPGPCLQQDTSIQDPHHARPPPRQTPGL